MLGISKRIETLGSDLAKRFHERSTHYFETANRASDDPGTKRNMMLVAAILAEIGSIIAEVTKREKDTEEN